MLIRVGIVLIEELNVTHIKYFCSKCWPSVCAIAYQLNNAKMTCKELLSLATKYTSICWDGFVGTLVYGIKVNRKSNETQPGLL